MKIVTYLPLSVVLLCVLLNPIARADDDRFVSEACERRTQVCEKWQRVLPESYKNDFRTCNEPVASTTSVVLSCGSRIGEIALSYAKYKGLNTLILQLAAKVGVGTATSSMLIVAGYKAFAAYKAAQFVYSAFEADKKCFYNHEFKRGILEPIAQFYPQSHIDIMLQNRGCTDLGSFVHTKVLAVQGEISTKRRKQREYELQTKNRTLPADRLALIERLFPAEQRTLSEAESVFLQKMESMDRPTPMFNAIAEMVPCLKPEAISRMACGFVGELGRAYVVGVVNGDNADPKSVLEPALKRAIMSEIQR